MRSDKTRSVDIAMTCMRESVTARRVTGTEICSIIRFGENGVGSKAGAESAAEAVAIASEKIEM